MTSLQILRDIAARVRLSSVPDEADRILAALTLPGIASRLGTCADQLTGMIDANAIDKCDLRGLAMELSALSDDARALSGEGAADRHMARARRLFGVKS